MRLASAAALCLLFAPPALAAATDWQEMAPGMRARMISADTLSDGKTLVGIELDMPQGTKTYWRVPGETGLPASLDLSRSAGIAGHALFWPMPERERVGGYLDYVYRGHVVLPLSVTLAGPALLAADVTLGVCSDICVPASATFTLPLAFEKPDPGNGLERSHIACRRSALRAGAGPVARHRSDRARSPLPDRRSGGRGAAFRGAAKKPGCRSSPFSRRGKQRKRRACW
jgi:DsbC/DsbD-like thiol-disulfide interchange protein